MDFALNEEQRAVFDMARAFADDKIAPHALEWDETGHFPIDVIWSTAMMTLEMMTLEMIHYTELS